MKTTYLINKAQADGRIALTAVSQEEWYEVMRENQALPSNKKRYFIDDWIIEGKFADRMIIEVSQDEYREWNREHMRAERNRKRRKRYSFVSLDGITTESDELTLQDRLSGDDTENIFRNVSMEEMRATLQNWQPWAFDFMRLYLSGEKHRSANILSEKYGVTPRMIRNYRKQFEIFIKNLLN